MYHFIPISLVDCNEQVADPVFCFRYHASRNKRVEISSDGNMMQHLKDEKSPFFGFHRSPPMDSIFGGIFCSQVCTRKRTFECRCLPQIQRPSWVDDGRCCRNVFGGEHETAKHFMDFNLQLNKVPHNWKGPKNNI